MAGKDTKAKSGGRRHKGGLSKKQEATFYALLAKRQEEIAKNASE